MLCNCYEREYLHSISFVFGISYIYNDSRAKSNHLKVPMPVVDSYLGKPMLSLTDSPTTLEENLTQRPGVGIVALITHPSGGTRDPHALLNETAHQLHDRPLTDFDQSRTYNTYDGQNQAQGLDWYRIDFPQPVTFNCIELTMGIPYRDGGWRTSLNVEVRDQAGAWVPVANLGITPDYQFADSRLGRRPYETYALTFDEVTTQALRLIGRPGGIAQFTSLGQLAAYRRNLSLWNPTNLPAPPVPYLYQQIAPQTVWDMSDHLAKLTGLAVGFPLIENYLDEQRYQRLWQRVRHNYEGEPNLWFLVGEAIGWDAWRRLSVGVAGKHLIAPGEPYVRLSFYNMLAGAVAPAIVDGHVHGEMTTRSVILKDTLLRAQLEEPAL
jgi:hypothetical protein